MLTGKQYFNKIRNWANTVGATITDSEYFDVIVIEYKNKKFKAEMQVVSTCTKVVSRGRGLKWVGKSAGFYFGEMTGSSCYLFKSTQKEAVETMEKIMK